MTGKCPGTGSTKFGILSALYFLFLFFQSISCSISSLPLSRYHNEMINQSQLIAIIILVGLITFLISFIQTGTPEKVVLIYAGIISSIIGLIILVFDSLLWKIKFIYPWFVQTPNLNGKWKVDAKFYFLSAENSPIEVQGDALIEQNYSSLYLEIIWKDGYKTEFYESTTLAISGKTKKHHSFRVFYKLTDKQGNIDIRDAMMAFDLPGRLFQNSPKTFTINYSTHTRDRHDGTMIFKKLEEHKSS